MPDYTYVIVGGGMTADAAAQAIREADPAGTIGLIGAEPHPPYDRPPLSKALWKGEPEEKIWRKTASTGAELHLGRRIGAIDVRARQVTDDRGTRYRFTKLLLATGGTPRQLPLKTDQIIYYRTLDDYRRLRPLASQSVRFGVIGGRFVGLHCRLLSAEGRDHADGGGDGGARSARGVVYRAYHHRRRAGSRGPGGGTGHHPGGGAGRAGGPAGGQRGSGGRVLPHQSSGRVRRGGRRQLRQSGAGHPAARGARRQRQHHGAHRRLQHGGSGDPVRSSAVFLFGLVRPGPTWAMKRWGSWTPGSRRWRTGRSPSGKA